MSTPTPAMLYTQGYGSRPESVEVPVYSLVAPSSSNINYPLGKRWVLPGSEYVLTSFTSSNGALSANWTLLGNSGSVIIASAGTTAAMTAGSVNVTDANAETTSVIIYSVNTSGGTVGNTSVVAGTGSFVINSSSNTETSTFNYIIVNS